MSQIVIYIISLLKYVCLQHTSRSSCSIVSGDIYATLFISTVIPFSHVFASQFGLANFIYRRKNLKTSANTECSVNRQVAPDKIITITGAAVAMYIYIDCEQNGESQKHVSTRPTASQSTCHGDDNHWADIYE